MSDIYRPLAVLLICVLLLCGCQGGDPGAADPGNGQTPAADPDASQEGASPEQPDELRYPTDFSDMAAVEAFVQVEGFWDYLPRIPVTGVLEDGSSCVIPRVQTKEGIFKTGQGACTDGTYAYVAMTAPSIKVDGVVQDMIFKVDMSTWEIVDQSEPLGLDHANGMAYNSKTNLLLVAHGADGVGHKISFVDPETLTIVNSIELETSASGLTYNETRDQYAVRARNHEDFFIYDGEFHLIKSFKAINLNSHQCIDSNDDYILLGDTGGKRIPGVEIVKVYTWDGELKGILRVGAFEEQEALFHVGDDWYITFNCRSLGCQIRRMEIDWSLLDN